MMSTNFCCELHYAALCGLVLNKHTILFKTNPKPASSRRQAERTGKAERDCNEKASRLVCSATKAIRVGGQMPQRQGAGRERQQQQKQKSIQQFGDARMVHRQHNVVAHTYTLLIRPVAIRLRVHFCLEQPQATATATATTTTASACKNNNKQTSKSVQALLMYSSWHKSGANPHTNKKRQRQYNFKRVWHDAHTANVCECECECECGCGCSCPWVCECLSVRTRCNTVQKNSRNIYE